MKEINYDGMPLFDDECIKVNPFKTKEELEQMKDTPMIVGSNMKEKADALLMYNKEYKPKDPYNVYLETK